jgi:hypothetical protein
MLNRFDTEHTQSAVAGVSTRETVRLVFNRNDKYPTRKPAALHQARGYHAGDYPNYYTVLIKHDIGIPIFERARPAFGAAVQLMENATDWNLWFNPMPTTGAVTKK